MKMPEIQFTMEGRSYSMTFEDDGRGNEFAIVTSDRGNTKRIIFKGWHCPPWPSLADFFNSVKELFTAE